MISKIRNQSISYVKSFWSNIFNFPTYCRDKIFDFKETVNDYKYRLNHLEESNYELGLYHLNQMNINDAIMRFKLINMFFKQTIYPINYWLGWCYYLKGNELEAIKYLNKTNSQESIELREFLSNISIYNAVPDNIWRQYRDITTLTAPLENEILNQKFAIIFAKLLINAINNLSDEYNILDLGSNIGVIGEEIIKRLPTGGNLIGVEPSTNMNQLVINNSDNEIYHLLINSSINEFLLTNEHKFDIIYSCGGVSLYKNPHEIISKIKPNLTNDGYIALCFRTAKQTNFSIQKREFIYDIVEFRKGLVDNNFDVIHEDKFSLGITDNYAILIGRNKNR